MTAAHTVPAAKGKHRMKLLTVTIPCYNAAAYMERCLKSVVSGGDELDVIVVDDGSTDETGRIADKWAAEYPGIVRVIHQENGGHGEGLNQGIRNAEGIYFKSVDSDDRLDPDSLKELLTRLKAHTAPEDRVDMIVNDYVYDREWAPACFSVSYRNVFRPDRVNTWENCGAFPPWKQFMIHALAYRTGLLREMNLVLPKHTFYEDNLYIYQPLPYVKKILYLDKPLYGYFIEDGMKMNRELKQAIRDFDRMLYRKLGYTFQGGVTMLPGRLGRGLTVGSYRFGRKMIKF